MTGGVRPSATLVPLRQVNNGFEVLLLRRSEQLKFGPGCWVFPGGTIDADDGEIDENIERQLPAARRAAVRETREECGLIVDTEQLTPYAHWTTPMNSSRRYATWFLLGELKEPADVVVDGEEIDDFCWLPAREALDHYAANKLSMMPPTYITLLDIAKHDSIESFQQVVKKRPVQIFAPRMLNEAGQLDFSEHTTVFYPGDVAYESQDISLTGQKHRLLIDADGFHYINEID